MKRIASLLTILSLLIFGVFGMSVPVFAATSFTITYQDLNGTVISTATVDEGDPLGALPVEADLLAWIYQDCREATATTVPTSDLTVTAVHNADVLSSGTLDGGNIKWFILNNKLYVTGAGTINILDRVLTGVTKTYTASINQVNIKYPSIMYGWLTAPAIEDEQGDGYGSYTVPATDEYTYPIGLSNELSFPDQDISYPATAILDAVPWSASAATLTDIYFSDDVVLTGNYTLYFNLNSTTVLPSQMDESVYTNLQNIYMYADTSGIKRMAGMYAYCPKLENVYLRDGKDYDMTTCVDMSLMFYGDELLKCTDGDANDSIINHMINTGAVTDMRYAFFDCKSLVNPALNDLTTSNVGDMSYMFAGCEDAGFVCDGSGTGVDLSGWDTGNVFSMAGMFAAPSIDLTADEPITNTWGLTDATVCAGAFDLSRWNLTNLQTAFLMFGQNHGLTELVLGDAPVLSDIAAMACWCDSLQSVSFAGADTPALTESVCAFFNSGVDGATGDFSGWNLDAMTDMRYMFYRSGFSTLNFDGTNPALLEDASGMFSNCDKLTSLGPTALSAWTLPHVTDTSRMFNGDAKLTTVNTSGWGMNDVESIAYMFADCPLLSAVDASSWKIDTDLRDMDCAFLNCASIPSLDIESWNVGGVVSAFDAFANMTNLETIKTSGLNFNALQVANGMFHNDISLTGIDLWSTNGAALEDAAGMFYGDVSLSSASVKDLVKNNATNTSYFMTNCASLPTLDISGWDTSSVEWMQGMFDGMLSLTTLSTGTNFDTGNALSTGAMFRNCASLSNENLQAIIDVFDPANDEDLYAMFENCIKLTVADLSGKNFAAATNYNRMFYGDDNLVTIILPANFMSGITDTTTKARNAFYCTEETPTFLTYLSDTLSDNLKNYNWDGDNRVFVDETDAKINGTSTTTYKFTPSSSENATMELDAVSTFYLNTTPLPLSYEWSYGGTPIAGATDPTFTATKDDIGSYTAEAYLADLLNASGVADTFTLSAEAGAESIAATYTGPAIALNNNYSKDDVGVVVTFTDGTKKTLTSSEFSVDSQLVTKNGNNNTYTATYTDGYGSVFTSTFTVPGKRVIGSATATYVGPSVTVGKEYDPNYVIMTAYYEDDTSRTEGFRVTPSLFSDKKVTKAGTNTFTAYYNDTTGTGKTLAANFTVPGYESSNVSSITAEYTGPSIVVGNNYDKGKVKVTIHYSDGTPDAVTTSFAVDDLLVKTVGNNTYTAAYTAPNGMSYETKFTVPGVAPSNNQQNGTTNGTTGRTTTGGTVTNPATTSVGTVVPNSVPITGSGVAPIVAYAQTGDYAPIVLLFVVVLIALGGLILIILVKKDKLHFTKPNFKK